MMVLAYLFLGFAIAGNAKGQKPNDIVVPLNCSEIQQYPAAIWNDGYQVTRFGAITFSITCSPPPEGVTRRWRWTYLGIASAWNATSFKISPPSPGYQEVGFYIEECNSNGCGGGTSWIRLWIARRAEPPTVQVIGEKCQRDSLGHYLTEIDFKAPDPDGDDPSTVERGIEKRGATATFSTFQPKNGDFKSDTWVIRQWRPGITRHRLTSFNRTQGFGLPSGATLLEVDCPAEYTLKPTSLELAQSVLIAGSAKHGPISLIQNKPVVARLNFDANKHGTNDNARVGVKVKLRTDSGAEHILKGCFRPSQIDIDQTLFVNLFSDLITPTFNLTEGGKIDFEVNPPEEVGYITPGVGCTPDGSGSGAGFVQQVAFVQPVSRADFASFVALPSPTLPVKFFKIVPDSCEDCGASYKPVTNFPEIIDRSVKLIKAMFPISPSNVFPEGSETPVIGSSWRRQYEKYLLGQACPDKDFAADERASCFFHAALTSDLKKVREAAKSMKINSRTRLVGIVSNVISDEVEERSRGYFGWHWKKWKGKKEVSEVPALKGIRIKHVPNAILAIESSPHTVVHELVHTFDINYEKPDKTGHQNISVRSNGFWVDLINDIGQIPSGNNRLSGLRLDAPSINWADIEDEVEWPLKNYWMDNETYNKLIPKLGSGPVFQALHGHGYFISGYVTKRGKFIPARVYLDTNPEVLVGHDLHRITFSIRDAKDLELSSVEVPFGYDFELTGAESSNFNALVAPISTNIPTYPSAVSVVARTSHGVETRFFPFIEILKTSIMNIPDSSYNGEASLWANKLLQSLETAERFLRSSDFIGAGRILSGEFIANLQYALVEKPKSENPLEVRLSDVLQLSHDISSSLQDFAADNPIFSNGLVRIRPEKLVFQRNEPVVIHAIQIRDPKDPGLDFYVAASFEGGALFPVESVAKGRWKFVSNELKEGANQFDFHVFVQNRQDVARLEYALKSIEHELTLTRMSWEIENDVEKKEELKKKMEMLALQSTELRNKIASSRVRQGSPVTVNIEVL